MDYFRPYAFSADAKIVAAWDSQVARVAETPCFERVLIERCADLFPRFADCYAQLRALPRGARRALQRQLARSQELAGFLPELLQGNSAHALQQKLARSLAGAALLLALGQGVAQAGIIFVTPKTAPGIVYDANCSITEAIVAANSDSAFAGCPAGSGADTIVLPKGTQKLTTYIPSIYSPTGLPLITSNITIQGDPGGSKIQGNKSFRLIGVRNTGTLTLNNLTLSGGASTNGGGAIFNGGYLYVNNCVITGNKAYGGGAISNYYGYSVINNSTISKNSANVGAGIFNKSNAPGARGDVRLNNSTVTGNKAKYSGGGIYSLNYFADVYINNSTIGKNSAGVAGGGIANIYGSVYVNAGVITGNKGAKYGGGIFSFGASAIVSVYNVSTLSKNSAKYVGGGIANIFGRASVLNSTISGNKAKFYGGGIYNYQPASFTNAGNTFSGNKAKYGPDVYTHP